MEKAEKSSALPSTEHTMVIRPAAESDIKAIHSIYSHYVLHGLGTFEETPPTKEQMLSRRAAVLGQGLPYLVAEIHGEVAGYCHGSKHRPRSAYRYTIEDSVYVSEPFCGRGIGTALLGELIAQCEAGPWCQMMAVIGHSGNTASIALHRRWGFRPVGTLRSVGFKLGRWVDTVLMQRALGKGDGLPPSNYCL